RGAGERPMKRLAVAFLWALGASLPAAAAPPLSTGAGPAEAVHAPSDVLRVCADPDNLPYSRADGSGFENRIARVLAIDLGVDLQFAWLPDRRGFVRKTMGAGDCDVMIGVPVGFERVAATHPYYRSSYAWVQRADAGAPPAGFDDPRLAGLRIGVQLIGDDQATSPPGFALARHAPRAQVVGFPIPGEQPAAPRIVDAVAAGQLDAGVVWGPQAGYFVKKSPVPLVLTPLATEVDTATGYPMSYNIGMAVRRRDHEFRDSLQTLLDRKHSEILGILKEYGVPAFPVKEEKGEKGDDDDGPKTSAPPSDSTRASKQ
ncbi:MAG: quinoprotein dehydrogenase-associated putative ABC transporter substrate-binding protein, partial [Gemmatimonadales bacterium]